MAGPATDFTLACALVEQVGVYYRISARRIFAIRPLTAKPVFTNHRPCSLPVLSKEMFFIPYASSAQWLYVFVTTGFSQLAAFGNAISGCFRLLSSSLTR